MHTANRSSIKTFGTGHHALNFRFRRSFEWFFWIVNRPYPILDAKTFVQLTLLADFKRRRLIDNVTKLFVTWNVGTTTFPTVSLF